MIIVQTELPNVTLESVIPSLPELLERFRAGDEVALNALVTPLYSELRRVASRHLRGERAGHTLQTTALVHKVYLKLAGDRECGFNDRTHFLSIASRVMRKVLVDYARARARKSVLAMKIVIFSLLRPVFISK